jgi:hypothetical protein
MTGLLVVVGVENLGFDDDDGRMGLLFTATALGALLTSALIARVQRTVPTGLITIGALTVSWSAQMGWAVNTSLAPGLALLVVYQCAATLSIMNGIIVRQTLAPDRLQARVNTTARMIAWGGTPLGAGVGGAVAQWWGVSTAIIVCSSGVALAVIGSVVTGLGRTPLLAQLTADPG